MRLIVEIPSPPSLPPSLFHAAVFRALEAKEVTYVVVPAENSRAGSVQLTLDQLINSPLRIRGETYLPVEQCLLANTDIPNIRRIYSMPVVSKKRFLCTRSIEGEDVYGLY